MDVQLRLPVNYCGLSRFIIFNMQKGLFERIINALILISDFPGFQWHFVIWLIVISLSEIWLEIVPCVMLPVELHTHAFSGELMHVHCAIGLSSSYLICIEEKICFKKGFSCESAFSKKWEMHLLHTKNIFCAVLQHSF